MCSEHEFHSNREKEQAWLQQNFIIESILKYGIQVYADTLDHIFSVFKSENHTLCCIDEGTPFGDMRCAGSGILLEGEERQIFIKKLQKAGVKEVTSHVGCGAAGLYREKKGLINQTLDEVAIEGAERMAKELGVPYTGHRQDLHRPKEFHNARVIYVDGTGHFNPTLVNGLPQGFVISRRFMSENQTVLETQVAITIALGDHGFGQKFSKKLPFILIAIGEEEDSEYSTSQLRKELEQCLLVFHDKSIEIQTWTINPIHFQK